ncbi:hypothetical protein M8818_003418 [Zalaria obscura]|uniref:Uncharacterized protein n=1 Tax=Zalaria obscura TaxID=2024903 RepID=A0ACC3SE60_9PEZI
MQERSQGSEFEPLVGRRELYRLRHAIEHPPSMLRPCGQYKPYDGIGIRVGSTTLSVDRTGIRRPPNSPLQPL